ncbi:TraC family protein [Patescibacteria group bacterium]|nr:TraC family protein [Patescibacteria group bacterium]
MSPLNHPKTRGSARTQIGIKEVRDNVLILPGNRYRTILTTSSVNFELQSDLEQDALIDTFQSFLNSLTTPIQILVRVRELDIDRYLEDLQTSRKEETEEIYQKQLTNYCDFIRKLVAGNKILSRRFYIVIPYDNKTGSDFALIKEQLLMNQEIVIKGMEKLGMTARQLTSLEILDLFYSFYRPEEAKIQPLTSELMRKTNGFDFF